MEQKSAQITRGKIAAGVLATILFGFVVGIIFQLDKLKVKQNSAPARATTAAVVQTNPRPVIVDQVPGRSSAPVSSAESDRLARIDAIDEELAEIPPSGAEELKAVAEDIRQNRMLVARLREQLRASDRDLLVGSLAASSQQGNDTSAVAFEQARVELEEELHDAKRALDDQRRYVNNVTGDETQFVRELRAELVRRQAAVAEIEGRIRDFFSEKQLSASLADNERSRRFGAWRAQRAELESQYANALVALEFGMQDYSDLTAANAASQKRIEALRAERNALTAGPKRPAP